MRKINSPLREDPTAAKRYDDGEEIRRGEREYENGKGNENKTKVLKKMKILLNMYVFIKKNYL